MVAGFMRGIFARGVECEKLCEEFWLGYGDGTVCIVYEVESEEAGGLAIQGYLVVLADVGDNSVDVGVRIAEIKVSSTYTMMQVVSVVVIR